MCATGISCLSGLTAKCALNFIVLLNFRCHCKHSSSVDVENKKFFCFVCCFVRYLFCV